MDRRDWLAAGLFAASIVALAAPTTGQVLMRSGLTTPDSAFRVVAADFNRDGNIDLAVSPFGSNGVQVFLGRGDGTFGPPVEYAPGEGPTGLAVGDLNNDGNPDIVISNDAGVIVLLGNGDGTFQSPVNYATAGYAGAVVLGDFNNDGNLDIATADNSTETVTCQCISVLLGNGDGTFQEPGLLTYPPYAELEALTPGNFTGGGNLDLALTESFPFNDTVQVLLGNGDGTFSIGASYDLDPSAEAIVTADLRNNGINDLAVAPLQSPGVAVLLGNGDGTFEQPVYYDFGHGGASNTIAVGDMNGDGIPDLVSVPFIPGANYIDYSAVYIFPGNGNGTFGTPEISYPTAYNSFPRALALADFNGDHQLDVTFADEFGSPSGVSEYVLLNTGQAKFSPVEGLSFPNQKHGTTSPPQIVTITNEGPSTLNISSMTTTGNFEETSTCGKSVAAKASCTISVTFRPTTAGEKYGTVSIIDSASSKPQVIALSGTAY
jgi:hypothetical protein